MNSSIGLRNLAKLEQRTLMISADISEYSTNHVSDIYVFLYIALHNLFDNDCMTIYALNMLYGNP
jgi:hypothetical protein